MDSIIALLGNNFVLMAADQAHARSIVKMTNDVDKIFTLDDNKLMGMSGEHADMVQFGEYVQRNIALNKFRHDYALSTKAVATWTRSELAKFLRQSPYQVNSLIGGLDKGKSPSLFYLDYLGSLHQVKSGAAQGYCAYFVHSILDRYWEPNMELEPALELLKKCIQEVSSRLVISQPSFAIKIIDSDGIRVLETFIPSTPAAPSAALSGDDKAEKPVAALTKKVAQLTVS